jgi:hypothetical protein
MFVLSWGFVCGWCVFHCIHSGITVVQARLRILKTWRVYQRYSVSLGLVNALNYFVLCHSGRLNVTCLVLSRLFCGILPSSLVENNKQFKTLWVFLCFRSGVDEESLLLVCKAVSSTRGPMTQWCGYILHKDGNLEVMCTDVFTS